MDSTAAYINALIDSLVYVYDLQFHKDLDKKLNINISSDKRPIYKLTRNLYGLARGSSLWQTFITKTALFTNKILEFHPFERKILGIMPCINPLRHDTAKTIREAKHLGLSIKMLTGDAVYRYCQRNLVN